MIKKGISHIHSIDSIGIYSLGRGIGQMSRSAKMERFLSLLVEQVLQSTEISTQAYAGLIHALGIHGHPAILHVLYKIDLKLFSQSELLQLLNGLSEFENNKILSRVPVSFKYMVIERIKDFQLDDKSFYPLFLFLAQINFKDETICKKAMDHLANYKLSLNEKLDLLFGMTYLGIRNEITQNTAKDLCQNCHPIITPEINFTWLAYIASFQMTKDSSTFDVIKHAFENKQNFLQGIKVLKRMQIVTLLTEYPKELIPDSVLNFIRDVDYSKDKARLGLITILNEVCPKISSKIIIHQNFSSPISVDFFIEGVTIHGKKVVLEIRNSFDRTCNTHEDLGATQMKRHILENAGYHVEYFDAENSDFRNYVEQFTKKFSNSG